MGAYVSLAALFVELAFLAVVLGAAGFGVNKLINRVLASRTESMMREKALVAGARARAHARAKSHLAF